MNKIYEQSLQQASKMIIDQVCGVDVQFGDVEERNSFNTSHEVVIVLGFIGEVRGQILFSIKESTAKWIASKLMCGMPVEQLDDMSKSALSELGNMIMGNTATLFSQQGVTIDITPPSIMLADNLQISSANDKVTIIPVNINEEHDFDINVIMETK